MRSEQQRVDSEHREYQGNIMKRCLVVLWVVGVLGVSTSLGNSAPRVSNVRASQRGDDSKLVDVYYDLADADGDACTVWVIASNDGGATWRVPIVTVWGDGICLAG